jgi:hypothetical protein
MNIVGVDFTSRPTAKKPITVAHGVLSGAVVKLVRLERYASFEAYSAWLKAEGEWIGAFDLPFSLPRELISHLGWSLQWLPLMQHYASLSREQVRELFKAFCDARPAGAKFAHRATDKPAGSSPSMKWVNPPVAYMLHAGVPFLLEAGIHIPVLHDISSLKAALEGYPGLLARELIGNRSYKSDDKLKQTPERFIARKDILTSLEASCKRAGLRSDMRRVMCDMAYLQMSMRLKAGSLRLIFMTRRRRAQQLAPPRLGPSVAQHRPSGKQQ